LRDCESLSSKKCDADQQAVWVMHQAGVTEQMRVEIERKLREQAAEDQAAWVAEQEAAAAVLHEQMFAAARDEVAAEAELTQAENAELAAATTARIAFENGLAEAAREAKHAAEIETAMRELDAMRAENEVLRKQV
jgi:hypothetical protein